ncbi:MAG: DEAD/DEAH box helicase [Kiritimatiellae bacterium]|nr:DEAD/DEAH box helicase [Kiritimatiellia bacterium]
MTILHGVWLEGRLQLWGEAAPLTRAARGASAPSPPAPSPFDAGAAALARAVAALAGSVAAARAHHVRPASVWLPTGAGLPLPSHSLLLPADQPVTPPGAFPVTLQVWRITLLPLSWPERCAVLGACAAGERLGRHLLAGHDLMAWSLLARLGGALVARQAHLPSLIEIRPDRFESRWQPLLDGAERRRLEALCARLPPAACAAQARAPSHADIAAAAQAFLEDTLDRLVRGAATTPLTRAHALKGRYTCAHTAWLASLRGDGRQVRWDHPADLRALAADLAAWRRPLDLGLAGGSRLKLRLCEPRTDQAWHLQYLLAGEDGERCSTLDTRHSTPRNRKPRVESRESRVENQQSLPSRRDTALTSLGQAALLCPLISDAGGRVDGRGIRLNTGEAYTFLTNYAPLLQAAGFDVQPPDWWRDTATGASLRLRARLAESPGEAGTAASLGLDDLVQVNWELALGDHRVTVREIEALLKSGEALARLHGRWIAVDGARCGATLRAYKRRLGQPLTVRELMRLSLGAEGPAGVGVEVVEPDARGAAGSLLRRLRGEARLQALPPPPGFRGELRPYQLRGFAWLAFLRQWGLGACLADDMGLGKTVQALALLAQARAGGERRPALLVCPMSIIGNWLREAARFTPELRTMAHHGAERAPGRLLAESAAGHDLVVTSYHLMQRDFAALHRVHWSAIVLDEAQNVKNPATRQSRAARALTADFRLALTGTPVENQAGDLWALMDFLNPGMLGTRADFQTRFQRPIRTGVDDGARSALKRITSPFILRRLKSDPEVIADLPARIEAKVYCSLTREQATLYAAELRTLDAGLEQAEGLSRRGLVLATLTRLKQICNHPAHFLGDGAKRLNGRSGKMMRFDAMLEELAANGDRALVFTQYAVMGALLRDHMRDVLGCDVPFLHGGVPGAARDAMVARFQAADGPPAFILSLKAGGTGLNLTRANHVFHFDRWWNPAVENQATDRAHRIGQTRTVFVHKFICAGTMEERIDAMIESKTALADGLIGSGEGWLTGLSNERLREVLALSAEAVTADGEADDGR